MNSAMVTTSARDGALLEDRSAAVHDTLVALSGGVDSAVAAALLKDEGRRVAAVTLVLTGPKPEREASDASACPEAARVASALGAQHYILDERRHFEQAVISSFAKAFATGRTPNPCVSCNERVKFAVIRRHAERLGVGKIATGHYARIGLTGEGRYRLLRGRDLSKDQSYFLYRLGQEELSSVRFPLGEMSKSEVKRRARRLHLVQSDVSESQDICFLGGRLYHALVEEHLGHTPPAGRIVHVDGRVLGKHDGIHRFTVGQRRGLNVATGERVYVVSIDADRREVRVGSSADLERRGLRLSDTTWVAGEPPPSASFTVRLRYRHQGVTGNLVDVDKERAAISFDQPVRAAAPGQAAVLYDGEEVVGGGTIEEVS